MVSCQDQGPIIREVKEGGQWKVAVAIGNSSPALKTDIEYRQ